MNRQLDISIITINYNGLQETCELIESLQQFLHKCLYEMIVVDNGSIQNEAVILQKKYPQILTIRSEQNLGFSGLSDTMNRTKVNLIHHEQPTFCMELPS